ncbi:tetratricopeptide repeat protein [Chryseobacterium lathyri]|uniref:tetratricopeptide repeat protein n=1 Tax=Chryseobacterium lathyri TaxID=395933 RepID=UPI00277E1769|nr:tetratricopeptide repeat protein [Chryseobacterium lathyri]MDQ0067361.1 tetratricopeptide (TPR) repeat protein [Chryseobacterium lathyri]
MQGENINYLLAISYQGLGNYKSKDYYEKFFETTDSATSYLKSIIYVNYGTLLEKLNFNQEALKQYNIPLKGHFISEAYFHMGEVYEKLGRKDSAIFYYKEALKQYDKGSKLKDALQLII